MESANISEAAPTAIEATNPLNKGQSELSDEFETKLNIENQNEEMHKEVDYSSFSDESSDDNEEEEVPMIVNPQPPRPTTTTGELTTLFACNLALQVKKPDIEEFFEEAGQVVDINFARTTYDGSFRGFAHISFASPEEAQKAMEFQGRTLLGRPIRLASDQHE